MELLPFSTGVQEPDLFIRNLVSKRELEELLDRLGAKRKVAEAGNNWACDYWAVEGFATPVGIVHHHTRGYHCVRESCLSIRLSAGGQLASCYTTGFPTMSIAGLSYEKKRSVFEKVLVEKLALEEGTLGYPRYHIPDYEMFRTGKS